MDLDELEPDHRVETVHAMTPWLVDRTAGESANAIAALPVPASDGTANPQYWMERGPKSE